MYSCTYWILLWGYSILSPIYMHMYMYCITTIRYLHVNCTCTCSTSFSTILFVGYVNSHEQGFPPTLVKQILIMLQYIMYIVWYCCFMISLMSGEFPDYVMEVCNPLTITIVINSRVFLIPPFHTHTVHILLHTLTLLSFFITISTCNVYINFILCCYLLCLIYVMCTTYLIS